MKKIKNLLMILVMLISFNTIGQTPVLYYSFDDSTQVINQINNTLYNGVLDTNKPTWKSNGCVGGYYQFNGSNYITFPNPGLKQRTNTPSFQSWTVSAWVYKDSEIDPDPKKRTKHHYLIDSLNKGIYICSNENFGVRPNVPMIYMNTSPPYYVYGSNSTKPTIGKWFHITYTLNDSLRKSSIYINGVCVDSSQSGQVNSIPSGIKNSLRIGVNFIGRIDELKIFNHSFNSTQATDLYNNSNKPLSPCTGPLPIELLSFNANCKNDGIQLNWSTGSEQNNDKFIIEKSRDGKDWININTIKGTGNSNTELNYTITDKDNWNSITYYRLSQIDFNGKTETFDPISIDCGIKESNVILYPNPNNGSFTIEVSSEQMELNTELIITDITGKIIHKDVIDISEGKTNIPIELNLNKGIYNVNLINKHNNKVIKMMVN